MPNHVSIDEQGIIHSHMEGDQDEQNVSLLIKATSQLVRDYQAKNPDKPLKFLVDMTGIGSQTLGARQVGLKSLKTMPYQKIAIIGASRFIKHIAELVIMASGQGYKVKQFEDQAKALVWLNA